MKYLKLLLWAVLLLPGLTSAHGPSRQKVIETIEINAAPEKVWGMISDFCSIADWNPMIKSCLADKGDEVGSVRTIELENGEKIKEKLFKWDATNYRMQYVMQLEKGRVVPSLPIATHGATITVTDNNGKSTVQWKGAFYRSFPGQQPPPELSDEACKKAVARLYKAGLTMLKTLAEE